MHTWCCGTPGACQRQRSLGNWAAADVQRGGWRRCRAAYCGAKDAGDAARATRATGEDGGERGQLDAWFFLGGKKMCWLTSLQSFFVAVCECYVKPQVYEVWFRSVMTAFAFLGMQYRYDAMIWGEARYTEAEAHGMVVFLCHWSNRGKDGIKKRKLVIQPRFDWSCCVSLYVWVFILGYLEDVAIWCHIAVSFLIIRLQEHGLLMCVVCVDGFRQIFDISATAQTQHHPGFFLTLGK